MAIRPLPDYDTLHQLLSYDPNTGFIFWKVRPLHFFKDGQKSASHNMNVWNSRNSGKRAATATNAGGYHIMAIDNKGCLAHRVIWKMVLGVDANIIDHINGQPGDNRIANLRSVTQADNCRNKAVINPSARGVRQIRSHVQSWQARIQVSGSEVYLGSFPTKNEAAKARVDAEKIYGFHDNHGRLLVK